MSIPRLDYGQYRKMRKLVHKCCNYDDGNCIALDDGETCVCVQSISYSLLCKWFRAAVLPLDARCAPRSWRARQRETLHRVRRVLCGGVKPGEELPRLLQTHTPPQRSGTAAKIVPSFYAF